VTEPLDLGRVILDLRARDLDRAVAFYSGVLELPLLGRGEGWAALGAQGAEIHLYLHGGATEGLEFRVADVDRAVESLRERGVATLDGRAEPGLLRTQSNGVRVFEWGRLAEFEDSEGNRLALVEEGTTE
jgi:predicted enzyme related to lactoylglutathione lyase